MTKRLRHSQSWQEWQLPGENPQACAVHVDEQDKVWAPESGTDHLVELRTR